MKKLQDNYIEQVRNIIDDTVKNSGYPVLGKVLEQTGVANRRKLRILESRGDILSVIVEHKNGRNGLGTRYVAYYTEREVPQWVQIKQAEQEIASKLRLEEEIEEYKKGLPKELLEEEARLQQYGQEIQEQMEASTVRVEGYLNL